jgi:hypothetical protein
MVLSNHWKNWFNERPSAVLTVFSIDTGCYIILWLQGHPVLWLARRVGNLPVLRARGPAVPPGGSNVLYCQWITGKS